MSTPPTPSTVSSARRICLSAISVNSRTGRLPLTASVMTGSLSGSDFGDSGRQHVRRKLAHRLRHLLANIFGRFADIALQHEGDDDVAAAFRHHRAHVFDAADRRDRFFERQNDLRGDLFRTRAGQANAHVDGRGVGAREQIDAQVHEAEYSQDDQEQNQHEGEDGPLDADFR